MHRYLPVLLPIIWAVVATLVALALYKTSKAFFEGRSANDGGQVRRIRLVGSVVIAAVTFGALWRVTPVQDIRNLDPTSRVEREYLAELEEAARALRIEKDRLEACRSMTELSQCASQVDAMGRLVDRVLSAAERVRTPGSTNDIR